MEIHIDQALLISTILQLKDIDQLVNGENYKKLGIFFSHNIQSCIMVMVQLDHFLSMKEKMQIIFAVVILQKKVVKYSFRLSFRIIKPFRWKLGFFQYC
jgi:hypothetical protein